MFVGAVPQHCRLLHQPPHGEKDLHVVHGDIQCTVHLHVLLRDDLSRGKTLQQTFESATREPESHIC